MRRQSRSQGDAYIVLRPTYRAVWPWIGVGMAALASVVVPGSMGERFLPVGFLEILSGLAGVSSGSILTMFSFIFLTLSVLIVSIHRFGRKYVLTHDFAMEQRFLTRKDTKRIRLAHIRSKRIQQGFWGQIFNIGSLQMTTSGTGGVDLEFRNILNPGAIEEILYLLVGSRQAETKPDS